jgi:hypothetical protein
MLGSCLPFFRNLTTFLGQSQSAVTVADHMNTTTKKQLEAIDAKFKESNITKLISLLDKASDQVESQDTSNELCVRLFTLHNNPIFIHIEKVMHELDDTLKQQPQTFNLFHDQHRHSKRNRRHRCLALESDKKAKVPPGPRKKQSSSQGSNKASFFSSNRDQVQSLTGLTDLSENTRNESKSNQFESSHQSSVSEPMKASNIESGDEPKLNDSEISPFDDWANDVAILRKTDNLFMSFDGAKGTTMAQNHDALKPVNLTLQFP